MQRTDLDTPMPTTPSNPARNTSRFVRFTCSGILIITCTIFGFTQTYAQDLAEAARQEKARKEKEQRKPKHVYTDEDLKRAQILTPEDRAEVEARKKQQPPPGASPAETIDAQAVPGELPLGYVARQYRRLREMLHLEQTAEFHLPFANQPAFAAPKPPEIEPLEAPAAAPEVAKHPRVKARPVIVIPAEPKIEPYQPSVKRSPFERPRIYFSAPTRSNAKSTTEPKAPAIGEIAAPPSTTLAIPRKPAAPAPDLSLMPTPRVHAHSRAAQPAAPVLNSTPSHASALTAPAAKPAVPLPDLRLMPAPRVKSPAANAMPTAPTVRAALPGASKLAAPAKPAAPGPNLSLMPAPRLGAHPRLAEPAAPVVGATPAPLACVRTTPAEPVAPKQDFAMMPSPRLVPHGELAVPTAPVLRGVSPAEFSSLDVVASEPVAPTVEAAPAAPAAIASVPPVEPKAAAAPPTETVLNAVTVKPGDSLWKLAVDNLGKGTRWQELLAVNPSIVNANHIVAGSQIFLPSIAGSHRTATEIIVRKGDTLSEIAQKQLGHASASSCIAQANPAVQDANVIYEGQSLLIPATCNR